MSCDRIFMLNLKTPFIQVLLKKKIIPIINFYYYREYMSRNSMSIKNIWKRSKKRSNLMNMEHRPVKRTARFLKLSLKKM